MLTDWLLAPAPPDVVQQRQSAVQELTPAIEFRDALQAMSRIAGQVEPEQLRLLLEWSESPAWLLPKRGLKRLAIALPTLTIATAGLHILAVVPYLWIIPIASRSMSPGATPNASTKTSPAPPVGTRASGGITPWWHISRRESSKIRSWSSFVPASSEASGPVMSPRPQASPRSDTTARSTIR